MAMAMMTCALCGAVEPAEQVFEHLRVMHPDTWDEQEKWPDGGLVVSPFIKDTTEDCGYHRGDGLAHPCSKACDTLGCWKER